MMQVHIYKDTAELTDAAAQWITQSIREALQYQDRFTLALSGGETPRALYKLLSADTYRDKIDWSKMHIFWGDERVVPFSDDSNNAKMAFDSLLNNVKIPKENIHIMQTGIDPGIAAKEYEVILHQYFDHNPHTFDLVLLGMGKDGHTLSLFPSSPLLEDRKSWAESVYVDDQKMYRITLMPAVVNKAGSVIFLITGKEKSATLKDVLQGHAGKYPAQLIQPENGSMHWFIDENAAGGLDKNAPGGYIV